MVEGDSPIKLSTGNPSYSVQPKDGGRQKSNEYIIRQKTTTYPPPMINQLLPIHLIQPRHANVIALRLDEPRSQLLVLAAHRIEHHLRRRLERVERGPRRDGGEPSVPVRRPGSICVCVGVVSVYRCYIHL